MKKWKIYLNHYQNKKLEKVLQIWVQPEIKLTKSKFQELQVKSQSTVHFQELKAKSQIPLQFQFSLQSILWFWDSLLELMLSLPMEGVSLKRPFPNSKLSLQLCWLLRLFWVQFYQFTCCQSWEEERLFKEVHLFLQYQHCWLQSVSLLLIVLILLVLLWFWLDW